MVTSSTVSELGYRPSRSAAALVTPLDLSGAALFYYNAGLAPNTHVTYSSGQKSYLLFHERTKSSPFPITEHKLCDWIAYLASNIAPKTIRVYMYAVRSLCVDGGSSISFKHMHQLQRVYNGIKKHHGITSTRPRLPITIGMLQSMYMHLDMQVRDDVVVWAAFTLAVANMLRVSEFAVTRFNQQPAPITHSDINLKASRMYYELRIRQSKTDQYSQGRTVRVFGTGAVTCPVRAMRHMVLLVHNNSSPPPQAAVFVMQNGQLLSRRIVERKLKWLVERIGLNPSNYNTHSLRRGGATSYALANVSDRMIQHIGGWASESYKLYIDVSQGQVREAALSASRIQGWFGALEMSAALAQQRSISDIGLFQ
jgi:hypothetical protein